MSIFFEELQKLKDFSLQTTTKSKSNEDIFHFDFDGLFGSAHQIYSKEITVSRIVFPFSYVNQKRMTKNNINNIINKFNSKVPLIKLTFKNHNSTEIQVDFSMEYTVNDNLFRSIDLNRDIQLLISGTAIFQDMLSGKSKLLDE